MKKEMDTNFVAFEKAKRNAENNFGRPLTKKEEEAMMLGVLFGRRTGIEEGADLMKEEVKDVLHRVARRKKTGDAYQESNW